MIEADAARGQGNPALSEPVALFVSRDRVVPWSSASQGLPPAVAQILRQLIACACRPDDFFEFFDQPGPCAGIGCVVSCRREDAPRRRPALRHPARKFPCVSRPPGPSSLGTVSKTVRP